MISMPAPAPLFIHGGISTLEITWRKGFLALQTTIVGPMFQNFWPILLTSCKFGKFLCYFIHFLSEKHIEGFTKDKI